MIGLSSFRALRYTLVFSSPILAFVAFWIGGIWTYALVILLFICVPLIEQILPADSSNLSEAERSVAARDKLYDLQLYLMVPIAWALVIVFVATIGEEGLSLMELIFRILTMGVICGQIGINVAHELGHRKLRWERGLAKTLLLSSLYMHFFIEHNRGHHKRVGTMEDPATARAGESLYAFFYRSLIFSYLSAWKLEIARLKKKGKPFFSLHNEMIIYQVLQAGVLLAIYLWQGWFPMLAFIAAAYIGIFLLENINYIEHYGLFRKKKGEGYEKVQAKHSWNSDFVLGRLLLFELTRHSDHHCMASKKYQLLEHQPEAPQMPAGYPAMMLLALVPPLWFKTMNHRIGSV